MTVADSFALVISKLHSVRLLWLCVLLSMTIYTLSHYKELDQRSHHHRIEFNNNYDDYDDGDDDDDDDDEDDNDDDADDDEDGDDDDDDDDNPRENIFFILIRASKRHDNNATVWDVLDKDYQDTFLPSTSDHSYLQPFSLLFLISPGGQFSASLLVKVF